LNDRQENILFIGSSILEMMNSTSMEACRQLIKITGRSYCTKVYLLYKDVLQTTPEEESKKAVKKCICTLGLPIGYETLL